MKKILGLDLGTNSIGWALVEHDFEKKEGEILGIGSRIIPMSQDILGEFEKGNSVSQTAERTKFRSVRRLRERHLLRRQRLHRVLNILDFLPAHYANEIDFEKRFGQFKNNAEPKIAYHNNEFIFIKSFNEMLEDFRKHQPKLLINKVGEPALVPYDWTIYYLRKKALSNKISKEELAWLILNFNQKRGYYQLRGEEEEENQNKDVAFYSLKVVDVIADEKPNNKGETWYSLVLENGWIYRRSSKTPLDDWKGKLRDFIVTTDLNEDGTVKLDKEGKEKRSFRAPSENDWGLIKKKTEQEIEKTNVTVGQYIYDTLLQNPSQKIKGKLVRTIERKFYKQELDAILRKQIELQPELFSNDKLTDCIRDLYRQNENHRQVLSSKDFVHLFINDIIFYQRPLRSQKSSISNCSYEFRKYKIDGVQQTQHLKAIPKSHPLYQEFRVLQWLFNFKIYRNLDDADVTQEFIKSENDLMLFYEFLMAQKEVDQKSVLKHFFKHLKGKALNEQLKKYRWNYVLDEGKKYPMNETGFEISKRLSNVENLPENFLNAGIEKHLWHIIYSVTDKKEFEQALKSFAVKHHLHQESFVESFIKIKPYESEYGSFSEKALKKFLPLMRFGKNWSWDAIDDSTRKRIDNIINAEFDESLSDKLREKAKTLTEWNHFQALPFWFAEFVVYDAKPTFSWKNPDKIDEFLAEFKQHSLKNPIVEQVVTETLRVVRDIWQEYGKGQERFFDEIHIELGREMKHTAEERSRMASTISNNEITNQRIKALLIELKNDNTIENVRPFSPMQQEILKIYEDGVLSSVDSIEDDIVKISKKAEPTKSELQRYKLWLEQKYRSPYTGQVISLSKLFTSEYEIEHVIPQSRYFDDSFSNKVICESAVNKLKDNQLGLEFIKNHQGTTLEVGLGKVVKILSEQEYRDFVNENYSKNRGKRTKLLLDEIPTGMIERQMNDTRYISKFISQILSNIVRSENNDEGLNSTNLIPGNGRITSILKQDWGLNDVWNDLILPRFERMNKITNSNLFTTYNEKYQKYLPAVPYEYSKGFQKKRIDHRHHALDALIIALATRDHINLLNNESAKSETKRYDLQKKLREMVAVRYNDSKTGKSVKREVPKSFLKPWPTITEDTRSVLEKTVVSFKQNLRLINKATNRYQVWGEKNGKLRKVTVEQKGINWAIRKSLHKDTVSGQVHLPHVKVPKDKILTATRKSLNTDFDLKTIAAITDTGIQKILRNYLVAKGGNPEIAFTPEGIEDMNKFISQYNDGKPHKPIKKVRVFELGSKFALGETGNKKHKFVEAAQGTNLFFAIYQDENGNRNFATIPLNEVIERQKQGLNPVPEKNEHGHKLLFSLSPNDLVYVPTKDEIESKQNIDFNNFTTERKKRLFNVNDFTNITCYFKPNFLAAAICKKEVDMSFDEKKNKVTGSFDTKTASFEGHPIKDICVKLNFNRLGALTNKF